MGRNVTEVTNQIKQIVPKKYRYRFDHCLRDYNFRAPEMDWLNWDNLQSAVLHSLPKDCIPNEEWQFEMLSIFSTLSIEEVKREYNK